MMKKFIIVLLSILMVLYVSVPCFADEEFDASMYETGITYNQMERTPDKYIGQNVTFSGIVLQVLEFDDENQGILLLDGVDQDCLYFGYDPGILDFRLLEYDYVTLYGYSAGLFSYEAISGKQITLPCMWVDWIEFSKEDEAETTFSVDSFSGIDSFDENEVIGQLEIEEKHIGNGWNYDLLVVKNMSDFNLKLKVDVTYYDENDRIIGVSSDSENAVESGYPALFTFSPDEQYYRAEYTFHAEKEELYDVVLSDLSYEESVTDSKVILSVTNNGSEPADFVEGIVLFYNESGEITDFDWTYFTDDDSELKPGDTITKEFKCFDGFSSYEVYFSGRRGGFF